MADPSNVGTVRIGSADRTLVAERLVAHYRAGRLPRGELELRLTKVAYAHTDDDLHLLTIDLPDVPEPVCASPLVRGAAAPQSSPTASPLRVAFDVAVLLLTFAAGVCLALLLIVAASGTSTGSGDQILVALLATLGAFTVGAGSVHLLHRAFGKR
jgi:hypothetical protein